VNEPLEGLTDGDIIERVLDGETDAFSVLVRRYSARVYALGKSFFRNEHDAADFAQEVFAKAYSKLTLFEGRSSFGTWLLRIGYNLGVNEMKRGKRAESMPEGFEPSSNSTPESELLASEAKRAVEKALEGLPPEHLMCLRLSLYKGMSYADIKDITGIPINTIKSHVFRAKERLRSILKDYGGS
jgi:RNA polymerase sigma-70 factor (ECF subfamily)